MDMGVVMVVLVLLTAVIAFAFTQPTPERQRAVLRTGLGLLVVLAILGYLRSLLMPFVVPLVIAYLMDPLLDKLERRGWPRVVGIVLVYIVSLGALVGAVILLAPPIINQITELASQLAKVDWDRVLQPQWLSDRLVGLVQRLPGDDDASYKVRLATSIPELTAQWSASLNASVDRITQWFTVQAQAAAKWALTTVTGLFWLLLLPITLWYALADWDHWRRRAWYVIPPERRPAVGELAGAINRALGQYLRGYAVLCMLVGLTTTAIMMAFEGVFGASYGLVVGVVAGLTYFVPYLGSITSVVLGTIVVFATGGHSLAETVWAFAILQTSNSIYDNIINPRLIGKQTGVHPLLVMFALLAGGKLLGLAGIVIATPLLLCAKVSLEYYFPRLGEPIPVDQNPDYVETDEGVKPLSDDPAIVEVVETPPEMLHIDTELEVAAVSGPEPFASSDAAPIAPQPSLAPAVLDEPDLPEALEPVDDDQPFAPNPDRKDPDGS